MEPDDVNSLDTRGWALDAPGTARSEAAAFEQICGRFAHARLIRHGLLTVAEKAFRQVPIEEDEARALLNLSLPLLGTLARLSGGSESPSPLVRAVAHLPLASWLEERGRNAALNSSLEVLSKAASTAGGPILHVHLDRWNGKFFLPDFFELLTKLSTERPAGKKVLLLSPSAAEISAAFEALRNSEEREKTPGAFLGRLSGLGIREVDCGDDFALASLTCARGLNAVIRQKIPLAAGEGEAIGDGDFISRLFFIKRHLAPSGCVKVWSPTVRESSMRPSSDGWSAVQTLRSMTIARLVLPSVRYFRADLRSLGLQTSRLALSFGANDLGFAAAEPDSGRVLGIPLLRELALGFDKHGGGHRLVSNE